MGKASRRKRKQYRDGHHDRVRIAGSVPAPNFEGAMVEATRYALAMVTSVHASPEDLPGLIEELAPDRARQGLVAYALVSELLDHRRSKQSGLTGDTNLTSESDIAGDHLPVVKISRDMRDDRRKRGPQARAAHLGRLEDSLEQNSSSHIGRFHRTWRTRQDVEVGAWLR
jgi:hypothetical protein